LFFIFVLINIPTNSKAETDCTILTGLDDYVSFSPAIRTNNTFGYNNLEFRLYSTENNTPYKIIVDNITIGNGSIDYFKKYVYWDCEQEYIENLTVIVGEDYYSYYNIFIFRSSFYNQSDDDGIEYNIKFTKEEFEAYLSTLRLKLFFTDISGLILGILVSTYFIREHKKTVIREI